MAMNRRQMAKSLMGGILISLPVSNKILAQGDATPSAMPGHGSGTGTSAAFMQITNHGDENDRLIAAHSDIAEITEIHTVKMDGGVMKMSELKDGLEIPAGETVSLERGGYHIMLINLTSDLHEGDEHTLTLEFERIGEVEIHIVVSTMAPKDAVIEAGDLTISGAHMRPAPMLADKNRMYGTGTSAAYMQITNHGEVEDTLVAVQTDVAEIAEIHTVEMAGGVMKMVELEEGLEIPAGETVMLERGSYHVMLINLARDLHDGDEVTLTLTFDVAGDVEITVPVTTEAPDSDPVNHGDLEIVGAFVRPAPMLSSDNGTMEATPATH